jgi:gamma-glutamyltranspeptidase/glutathione hydrolase
MQRIIQHIITLALLLIAVDANCQDRLNGRPFATRSMVIAQHGMACTSHPLATIAAIDILKKGGTAIDAAVAANAVLGVTDPEMNGIGGDLFAIVYDAKTKKIYGLNASGKSPYALTLADFKRRNLEFIPARGMLSISVPGCVDGWFELEKKFGKLNMNEVLGAAINYARNGFPVANEYAAESKGALDSLKRTEPYATDFLKLYFANDKSLAEGEIFKNPSLANTLEKIAIGGRDVFYKGEIANAIDKYMKEHNGFLSHRDFNDHSSMWIEPVSTTYRGYKVWELPPNGQGITVLQMLNILENFDLNKLQFGSAEHLHLLAEAAKLAYEDRAKFYADPEFSKIPVQQLISKKYGTLRSQLINIDKANDFTSGDSLLSNGETVYLTVADDAGNMISLIQSNSSAFGSEVVPSGLGFVLQNRGALFNLTEGQNNTYAPHKRPFHTIIPAFVTKDDKPFMSFGVMGGGFQPLGHVQILINIIDFGMNIQEAGDAPRIYPVGYSEPWGLSKTHETLYVESGFAPQVLQKLKALGHDRIIEKKPGIFGGYQCIKFDAAAKVYFGASERRKDGMAAGY